jgi:hypothetical protein
VRAWYCPSWSGDWRLEPDPDSPDKTRLTVEKPTTAELAQLKLLGILFAKKEWLNEEDAKKIAKKPCLFRYGHHVTLAAPLADVGPFVTSNLQPGITVLTAMVFRDGRTEVAETNKLGAPEKPKELPPAEPSDEAKALAKKDDVDKAVTVKRPTPCCPDCYVDAVGPATDVLLSFLNPEQHETWRRHRFLIVRGGITGHRYIVAHRNTPLATAQTRIAFDLEDQQTMHFHDWTVPPEEEVLATMLILRHREPWLRNEATALGSHRHKFKNPFGDGMDGVVDSVWTQRFGAAAARVFG